MLVLESKGADQVKYILAGVSAGLGHDLDWLLASTTDFSGVCHEWQMSSRQLRPLDPKYLLGVKVKGLFVPGNEETIYIDILHFRTMLIY